MSHKIILVGYPLSGLDALASLLHAAGMAFARPSRREGLTPVQITDLLRQAHGPGRLDQLKVGPVWQGLALDLLMANLDQPTWGWHDAHALPLLDFWCSVDPDVRVVLAYDHPERVLIECPAEQGLVLAPDALHQRLDDWSAYQEAALHFAYRHRDRCLLVHTDRVLEAPHELLGSQGPLARLAPAGWISPVGWQAPVAASDTALTAWLARSPVEASARAVAAYEEWQAVADLPASPAAAVASPVSVDAASEAWRAAWQVWAGHRVQQHQADAELGRRAATIAALEQQSLVREQALQAELAQVRAASQQQADAAQARLDVIGAEREVAATERDAAIAERDTARAQFEQAQDEAATLLEQLHRVQQSYETLYCAQQRDADAHALTHTQLRRSEAEAQNQRRQAEAVAQTQRSEREVLQGRLADAEKHGAELKRQVQSLTTQVDVLNASIARSAAERQAHNAREAAQRVDLETALRQAEQENALLLSQLHRVQETLERLHVERTAKPAAPRPPVPYGAADRIKQQLSYRLGAKMIEQSASLGGWMSMPWALKRVHADFRQERAQRAGQKLPPLHLYGDAHEAEHVKQHLSYRLGQAMIKSSQSPVGWLTLPMALRREVQAFRRGREQVAA